MTFSEFCRWGALLLMLTACCAAQVSSVEGIVQDEAGAAVAHAQVTLTNKETQSQLGSITNQSGEFSFRNVPPGSYRITVAVLGFKQSIVEVVAAANQASRVSIKLSSGAASEVVEVEAGGPQELRPTWNAWLEDPGPRVSFNRVKTVRTRGDYELVLDLAAFEYAQHDKSVVARSARSGLLEWLKDQRKRLKQEKKQSVRLKVLMIPDPALLSGGDHHVRNLDINILQMDKYLGEAKKRRIPNDPFSALKKNPNSGFRFGSAQFEFHTENQEGMAYIGLSLWANEKPLDEIIVPVCISNANDPDSCGMPYGASGNSDPVNAVVLALGKEGPAAAMQFIEFPSDRTIGVLQMKQKEDEYLTWSIPKLSDSLSNFIDQVLLKNFDKTVSDAALAETGYQLYNLLLPPKDPDAVKVRTVIEGLMASRLKMSGALADAPPIMVRIVPLNPSKTHFVPLGMIAVPVGSQKYFLGDYFRVDSPLPSQSYLPGTGCISHWVMVMAPDTDQSPKELLMARDQMRTWATACQPTGCISSIPDFEEWIGNRTPEKRATALLLLAHYEHDSLTFDHTEFASPFAVSREFEAPSIAIINACGAAAPGADEFVKALHWSGFQAVIATTTTVSPVMAGQYFNLLAKALEKHNGQKDYTISKAHFDAVHELEDAKSSSGVNASQYGAKALIYSLLGNGNLQLCSLPRKGVSLNTPQGEKLPERVVKPSGP